MLKSELAHQANAALLLVALADHKVRLQTSSALRKKLSDHVCQDIIDYIILPKFKNQQYAEGIIAGLVAIEQKLLVTKYAPHLTNSKAFEGGSVIKASLISIVLLSCLTLAYRAHPKKKLGLSLTCALIALGLAAYLGATWGIMLACGLAGFILAYLSGPDHVEYLGNDSYDTSNFSTSYSSSDSSSGSDISTDGGASGSWD